MPDDKYSQFMNDVVIDIGKWRGRYIRVDYYDKQDKVRSEEVTDSTSVTCVINSQSPSGS